MPDAKGIGQRRHHHVDRLGVTHPRAGTQCRQQIAATRHDFDTAGQRKIGIAEQDCLRRIDNRLLRRTAKTVDTERDRVGRQTAVDGCDTRHVGET